MIIRPLTDRDLAAAPAWLAGADLRADRWRDDTTRAVVGLDGDQVVAVGRIFTSRVHTDRYWTEITVDPRLRRRGLGSEMADHLAELRSEPRPLCARGFVSSVPALFARSLGAQPYQTCPPQDVWTSSATSLVGEGVDTVPGTEAGWNELQRAWVDTYAWVHAGWSPVVAGFEEPVLAGFTDELDLHHTRVVLRDGVVRAACFVFDDSPRPVVVAECRTADEPGGLILLRACVRDSLLSLADGGVSMITFDGHDTDPHFRPLLDELPATGEPFELLDWG